MAINISVSKEDIARSAIVAEPTWVPVEVTSYKDKTAKSDNESTNHVFTCRAFQGEYTGLVVYCQFNEKAIGMIVPFFEAVTGEKASSDGFTMNPEAVIGRKLELYLKPGEYNGKPQNQVHGYRAFRA